MWKVEIKGRSYLIFRKWGKCIFFLHKNNFLWGFGDHRIYQRGTMNERDHVIRAPFA